MGELCLGADLRLLEFTARFVSGVNFEQFEIWHMLAEFQSPI